MGRQKVYEGGIVLFILVLGALLVLTAIATVTTSEQVRAANPALFEADLSFNQTSSGSDYCALSDGAFNISVYYNTSGTDKGVSIQRQYRPDGVWRTIKEYTSDTETIEFNAPNSSNYHYRAIYTGSDGGAHVRIDQ